MELGRFRAWRSVTDAWSRLRGSKRVFVLMSLTVWSLLTAARLVLGLLLPAAKAGPAVSGAQAVEFEFGWRTSLEVMGVPIFPPGQAVTAVPFVEAILVGALSAVFAGAFAAFALRRAAGLPVEYRMLFRHTRHFPTFFTISLLMVTVTWLAAVAAPLLTIVPMIAIALAGGFVNLYVVDRDLGAIQAIGSSVGLAMRNLPQYLILVLIAWAVGAATGVTFGLAAIWLAPLLQIAYACAFRDAEGIRNAGEALPLEETLGRVTAA